MSFWSRFRSLFSRDDLAAILPAAPLPDLEYEPGSCVGPFGEVEIQRLRITERANRADIPNFRFDESYLRHLQQFHGGIPGKQWFRSYQGNVHRLGRFVNYSTSADAFPPPHQPDWLHGDLDSDMQLCRSYWSLECIANIADGCGLYLWPFGMLYFPPHHPDHEDPTYLNYVCFDYSNQRAKRPAVVVWFNDLARDEGFRCERLGIPSFTGMDHSRFTERVAENFDEFLWSLRITPEECCEWPA